MFVCTEINLYPRPRPASKALTLHCTNSFFLVFGIYSRVDSCRLPTHSRDAHRNFFYDPFLN